MLEDVSQLVHVVEFAVKKYPPASSAAQKLVDGHETTVSPPSKASRLKICVGLHTELRYR
jgi:hypothetical protein